ncbi:MAG: hypothetical protein Fur0035_10550 [Anaerolineales bacterium]
MSPITCPACGTSVEMPAETCPACGSALSAQAQSAPRFNSSAEAMDEVKRLLRAGNKAEAVKTHREYFGLELKDAADAVEAIAADLRPLEAASTPLADDQPPAFARPDSAAQTAFAEPVAPAAKPAWQKWAIGCSIALVLFCCLCVILPVIIFIFSGSQGG